MRNFRYWSLLSVGLVLALAGRANALPGQTPEEVAAWIRANPTLRPAIGERLLVRRSDSAAQRFTFQASVLQVGKASAGGDSGVIRTERFSLFDMINGVTRERLEESLRNLYGPDVYQDYNQASDVYTYPSAAARDQATNRRTPLKAALQGEVRSGDRYAYWLEIAQNLQGQAYAGQITVFLKEDLDKLEAELKSR